MIESANMELYVKLLKEYVHPIQPIQANPLDYEPQIKHPFPGNLPKEIPDTPPEDEEGDDE